MFWQKTIPILEIIRSIFWLPIPGSRNSILNWVLKLNHLLRSQSSLQALKPFFLGISNEMIFKIIKFRNKMACFITYMIPYIEGKFRMWRDAFSHLLSFCLVIALHHWFALLLNVNAPFSLTEKHKFCLTHRTMEQSQERNHSHVHTICFSEEIFFIFSF